MESALPSFMKGTASHSTRIAAVSYSKEREGKDIEASQLFSRADENRKPGFVLGRTESGKDRGQDQTRIKYQPVSTHFSLPAQRSHEDLQLDDSWGAEFRFVILVDRVRVFVRVRDVLYETETRGALHMEDPARQRIAVNRTDALNGESRFMFDRILPPSATQQDVYNEAVRPIVDDVLLGYNGSVMVYGQTGAGKTYTLSNMDPEAIGMMPRALADIFNTAAQDLANTYNVFMSYVQIYMEVIKDLLSPSRDTLAIREDEGGVFLSNVHEAEVKNTKDCLKLLQQGEQNRVFASTEMNAHSSRSHAIVIVTVFKHRKRAITRNENGQQVTGQYVPALS